MLKSDLFEICKDVASEFSDWSFVSGQFKNKSLKHTDLIIHPGFGFERRVTPLQPSVALNNKKSMALYKAIMGYDISTSLVNLQVVSGELCHMPDQLRLGGWIVEDKASFLAAAHINAAAEKVVIDIKDVRPILVAMMRDGISFIDRHYQLSSEQALLEHLPPQYTTRHANSPYDELDRQKGVMMCIVRVLLGDFDFVERYRSDDFKTTFPKRAVELDKLAAVLPDLKRRYAETGSAI